MRADPAISANTNAEDAPLHCPNCDYNLTGLPENRCPECGDTFDPVLVRRLSSQGVQPATPWDTERSFRGFWKTWWMAMASPRRLAAQFPGRHDTACATIFSWRCYALAIALFWGVTVFVARDSIEYPYYWRDLFTLTLARTLAALAAAWLCEVLVTLLLASLLRPHRTKRGFHFWRGLTHYTSGFTVLTAAAGGVIAGYVWLAVWNLSSDYHLITGGWIAASLVFVLWVVSLNAMIVARSRTGWRRTIACILLPMVGLLMAAGGQWLFWLLRSWMQIGAGEIDLWG